MKNDRQFYPWKGQMHKAEARISEGIIRKLFEKIFQNNS